SGQLYDHMFVRHWDEWADGTKNHLFALKLDGGKATGTPVDLMKGVDADAPTKPYGDDNDFAFTPDGTKVIYSARIAGRTEPWSTNFDLFEVSIDGSDQFDCSKWPSGNCPRHFPVLQRNLTAANSAADSQPVVSPDGRYVA